MTLFQDVATQPCNFLDSRDVKSSMKKALSADETDRVMFELIISDTELHRDILRYRPIFLSRIKRAVKGAGLSISGGVLVDYLDRQVCAG